MKKVLEYIEEKVAWLIFFGFILMIIAPYLIVNWSLCQKCNFLNTGPIGDTIGGITSPIVNLLGALLVYFAFNAQNKANETQAGALKSQVEANQILKEEIDRANFFSTYNEITELLDLTNIQFDNIRYNNKKGEEAFDSWLNEHEQKDLNEKTNKHFLKECFFVLELVDKTSKSIEAFSDINDIQVGQEAMQKSGREIEISNNNFNFKNLLRLKFQHFYQLKYNSTIIRLKNFTEAKEIANIYSDLPKFEAFILEKSKDKPDNKFYYQFQRILTAISNIEETLDKENNKFWGERPIRK